jgi:Protein of unknown function (DUF2975)
MPRQTELRRRAAFAALAAGGTAVALLVMMTAEKMSPPLLAAARNESVALEPVAAGIVQLLPAIAFTYALWALRGMFAGVANGMTFSRELTRALRRAGWALAAGAVAGVVLEPVLLTAIGKGPGYLLALDAAAIATGAVGVGLVAMASLLREAVTMKSELDGFM